MLKVSTYISKSQIHGIGLYAAADIPGGSLLWSFDDHFDRLVLNKNFKKLPIEVQDVFVEYGFHDMRDKNYYLGMDNDRFTNHSDDPNAGVAEDGDLYAIRPIHKNEEITENYKEFDLFWPIKLNHTDKKEIKNDCKTAA